jgi:3-oxoacyl-[acyl-carrier-protein] synthase-1
MLIVTELIMKLFIEKHIKLSFDSSTAMIECFRNLQVDYPKFFKMDNLSKLGFLASEMLLKSSGISSQESIDGREDVSVICFNRSSSLEIDMQYQTTIQDNDNYFPSPSLFVYTLPNIVAGEIAIRNKFYGETSFYVCEHFDAKQICRIVNNTFSDRLTTLALVAWVESLGNTHEIFMFLAKESGEEKMILEENKLNELYNK